MTYCKGANRKFVIATSRGPRNAATLLSQMADLERGARIRELRDARHLTQPATADKVGVTLRAYQEWEAGGGIQWENAKRLAKVLGSDPDYVMSGPKAGTPDLSSESQLDRIERKLDQLLAQDPAAVVSAVTDRLTALSGSPQPRVRAQRRSQAAGARRKIA